MKILILHVNIKLFRWIKWIDVRTKGIGLKTERKVHENVKNESRWDEKGKSITNDSKEEIIKVTLKTKVGSLMKSSSIIFKLLIELDFTLKINIEFF